MRAPRRLYIPPFRDRVEGGARPVITREQALSLSHDIMSLTSAKIAIVQISHTVKSVTQLASNTVRGVEEGERLQVSLRAESVNPFAGLMLFQTNQTDDKSLHELVQRVDSVTRDMVGWNDQRMVHERDEQDTYPATKLWYPSTVGALESARETSVKPIVDTVRNARLDASGFVGVMARSEAVLTESGISAFSEETDCEVNVTARPNDVTSTGWSGVATRDWSTVDPTRIATDAAETARRALRPSAVEPGRRTAILGPAAVVQLMRFFALHFDGGASDEGDTGFSKVRGQERGSRFKERLFDPRITITTDPTDPEAGFRLWFWKGYVCNPITWVADRTLKTLAYGVGSLLHGKAYADIPYGFRLHGGDTTVEAMIAQCDEGIYVNRFSGLEVSDWFSGMMTGVTRDGCFFIKHGKIDRPVKNFRFTTSPFFVLNNIIAMGPSHRAAFGFSPWTEVEKVRAHQDWFSEFYEWPRRPMVVPALMVRDFNFSALVDAV